jgi:hypothetical protein
MFFIETLGFDGISGHADARNEAENGPDHKNSRRSDGSAGTRALGETA